MARSGVSTWAVWLLALWGAACCADSAWGEPPARRILLLGQGPDGHPAGTHEYRLGLEQLHGWLADTPGLEARLEMADEPWTEGPELLAQADAVVLYLSEGARWAQADPRRQEALSRLAARGGGLAALHWAMGTREAEPIQTFLPLFGGCHGGPDRRYAVLDTDVRVVDADHPVTAGLAAFHVRDEFYFRLKFVGPAEGLQPLLTVPVEGRDETVAWAWTRPDGGRSFGFSGLHFEECWRQPQYRQMVTQGARWIAEAHTGNSDRE